MIEPFNPKKHIDIPLLELQDADLANGTASSYVLSSATFEEAKECPWYYAVDIPEPGVKSMITKMKVQSIKQRPLRVRTKAFVGHAGRPGKVGGSVAKQGMSRAVGKTGKTTSPVTGAKIGNGAAVSTTGTRISGKIKRTAASAAVGAIRGAERGVKVGMSMSGLANLLVKGIPGGSVGVAALSALAGAEMGAVAGGSVAVWKSLMGGGATGQLNVTSADVKRQAKASAAVMKKMAGSYVRNTVVNYAIKKVVNFGVKYATGFDPEGFANYAHSKAQGYRRAAYDEAQRKAKSTVSLPIKTGPTNVPGRTYTTINMRKVGNVWQKGLKQTEEEYIQWAKDWVQSLQKYVELSIEDAPDLVAKGASADDVSAYLDAVDADVRELCRNISDTER